MKKTLLLASMVGIMPSFSSMVFKNDDVLAITQERCAQLRNIRLFQPSRLLEHQKIIILLIAAYRIEDGLSELFEYKSHFISEYPTVERVNSLDMTNKINESLTDFINYNKENNEKLTSFYYEWIFIFNFMANFGKLLEESSDLLPRELRASFILITKLIMKIDNKIFGHEIRKREDIPSLEIFLQKCKECK